MGYARLVAAAGDVRLWDAALRQQIYLGDAAFVARMQALAEPRRPAARRATRSLAQWLSACVLRGSNPYKSQTASALFWFHKDEEQVSKCPSAVAVGAERSAMMAEVSLKLIDWGVALSVYEKPPWSEGVGEIHGEGEVWGCPAQANGDGRLDEQPLAEHPRHPELQEVALARRMQFAAAGHLVAAIVPDK